MLWNLFMILCGLFTYFIEEKVLKINVFSMKGIMIVIMLFCIIEFIKYLIINNKNK